MIYFFQKAGEIESRDLDGALRKAFGNTGTMLKEAPVSSGAVAEIYTGTGRKHLDTLISASGYPEPEPYQPPPADYRGEDDPLWNMIMTLREAPGSENYNRTANGKRAYQMAKYSQTTLY